MKIRLLTLAILLSLAATGARAQRGGGGGGRGGGGDDSGGGQPGGGGPSSGPTNPKPKNDAEKAAVLALSTTFNNPATTGTEMEAAITDFLAQYPKSDYVFSANGLGVDYFSNAKHPDADKTASYAAAALKIVPNNIRTLYMAAVAIPQYETAADPALAANLKLAEEWDNRLIATVKLIPDSGRGGGGLTPEAAKAQAAKMKQDKDQLIYGGYLSLARSATLRKSYPEAEADFEKALAVADWDPARTDAIRAQTYLDLAQSQEAAQKWPAAEATLDQAAKLGATDATLQQAVATEQAKLKAAGH